MIATESLKIDLDTSARMREYIGHKSWSLSRVITVWQTSILSFRFCDVVKYQIPEMNLSINYLENIFWRNT